MCERKYNEYKIIVTYLNGDKEELSYKGVNTSSYKDMMKFYQDIKKQYINESVTIDFAGVSSDGRLGILFTKKIITEETKQKEFADKVANTRVEDILEALKEDLKLLQARKEYCIAQQSIIDKKHDIEMHRIENFYCKKWGSEEEANAEKIKIFDKINQIRATRRMIKEDAQTSIKILGYINQKELEKIQFDHKEYMYLEDDAKIARLKIMEEVSYKNFKERINLMKQLEKKYRKVVIDEANMKIVCYNNAS